MVAKVADFGLSKTDETYVKTSQVSIAFEYRKLDKIFATYDEP